MGKHINLSPNCFTQILSVHRFISVGHYEPTVVEGLVPMFYGYKVKKMISGQRIFEIQFATSKDGGAIPEAWNVDHTKLLDKMSWAVDIKKAWTLYEDMYGRWKRGWEIDGPEIRLRALLGYYLYTKATPDSMVSHYCDGVPPEQSMGLTGDDAEDLDNPDGRFNEAASSDHGLVHVPSFHIIKREGSNESRRY